MPTGGIFGGLGYEPLGWSNPPSIPEGPIDNAQGSVPASNVFDTGTGGGFFPSGGTYPGFANPIGTFGLQGSIPDPGITPVAGSGGMYSPTSMSDFSFMNPATATDVTNFGGGFPAGGTTGIPFTGNALNTPEFSPGMFGSGTTGPDVLSTFGGTQQAGAAGYTFGGQPIPNIFGTPSPDASATSAGTPASVPDSSSVPSSTTSPDISSGAPATSAPSSSDTTSAGGGSGMPINVGLQPQTTQFIQGLTDAVKSATGNMSQWITNALQTAIGTAFAGVADWFIRAALILLGVIIVAVALWKMLDDKTKDRIVMAAGAAAA